MPNTLNQPTPRSQKVLSWLSFISLIYLAFMMLSYVFVAKDFVTGTDVKLGSIVLALFLAGFYLFTGFKQLFAQRRRMVFIVTAFVSICYVGQIWILKSIEGRIVELRDASAGPMDPLYPISMILLLSLPWYLPLLFPWIANFRKLPNQDPQPA